MHNVVGRFSDEILYFVNLFGINTYYLKVQICVKDCYNNNVKKQCSFIHQNCSLELYTVILSGRIS